MSTLTPTMRSALPWASRCMWAVQAYQRTPPSKRCRRQASWKLLASPCSAASMRAMAAPLSAGHRRSSQVARQSSNTRSAMPSMPSIFCRQMQRPVRRSTSKTLVFPASCTNSRRSLVSRMACSARRASVTSSITHSAALENPSTCTARPDIRTSIAQPSSRCTGQFSRTGRPCASCGPTRAAKAACCSKLPKSMLTRWSCNCCGVPPTRATKAGLKRCMTPSHDSSTGGALSKMAVCCSSNSFSLRSLRCSFSCSRMRCDTSWCRPTMPTQTPRASSTGESVASSWYSVPSLRRLMKCPFQERPVMTAPHMSLKVCTGVLPLASSEGFWPRTSSRR